MRVEFVYGRGRLEVTLPEEWVGEVVHPRPVEPTADTPALIAAALADPIGVPPLPLQVRPGQSVAIVIDDYTRKTPVHGMLVPVLAQLEMAGIARRQIRLVVALGTHRPMSQDEIVAKAGGRVAAEYEIVNVPSTAEEQMTYLGTSSAGIPAWVNRAVAEAEVRIGLGMITPHMDAGFSGGAKIILPGVCSERTVDAFHAASAFLPLNHLGNVLAPLRLSLEQFVAERVPLDMVVNVVTTLDGRVTQCVAGHPVQAHRRGVEHARAAYGAPVRRRYPVVVANCHPYDVDLWQSMKGAFCGDLVTADGGTLVLVTAAPEGNSTYPLVPQYAGRGPDEIRGEIQSGQAQDAKQAVGGIQFGALKQRMRLALVSEGLEQQDADAMGIAYYRSVEEAVADAVAALEPAERRGSVAVIPQAGLVLPLVA
jgi:nickel-dependent lactate racemase